METSRGASHRRVCRRRDFQSWLRAVWLVAACSGSARGAVRVDPRTAAAPRRLGGRFIRFGAVRLRHLLAVHLSARFWLGAGVADAAAADPVGCSDVSLCCRILLPVEPILAQARRDAGLVGPARALGAARVAARMAALRLPVAVDRLCHDRLALGWLGAAAGCVRRDLGGGVDIRGNQRGLHGRRAARAPGPGARRGCLVVCRAGVAEVRAMDTPDRITGADRCRARLRVSGSEVAVEKSRAHHGALSEADRRSLGCPPHHLAGSLTARAVDPNSRLPASPQRAGKCARRRFRDRLGRLSARHQTIFQWHFGVGPGRRWLVLQAAFGAVRRIFSGAGVRAPVVATDESSL